MRPLRLLQVGCGGRAQEHLKALARTPEVELLALCDIDAAKLAQTAERFGVSQTFTDMGAMIGAFPDHDCVSIITPPTLRARVLEPAIAAGAKAILFEKPIALTPSEARRLEELGQERLLAVNTQYSWMPHWEMLWPRLESGEFGEIIALRAWTRVNILEQGPHVLDLALRAAKIGGWGAPKWVLAGCAGREQFGSTPVPADTTATIGFENGDGRLLFNAGPSAPSTGTDIIWAHIGVEIGTTRGVLRVTLTEGWQWRGDNGSESGTTGWPDDDMLAQPRLFASLRDALVPDATGRNHWREFRTSVASAARVSDVMFACYASALENRIIQLSEQLDDDVVTRLGAKL